MNKDEAITLLAECAPLARKLSDQGMNIILTEADRYLLAGFNRVHLAGWLEDEYLHRQAGLLRSYVVILTAISIREEEKQAQAQG